VGRFRPLRDTANEKNTTKTVVIGGTGLIGSKLVTWLKEEDHEALASSLDTAV
jgi:nucleoside-diphosphate-sugar epimerase